MKNILILVSLFAFFLFSFTLLDTNVEDKGKQEEVETVEDIQDFNSDIDKKLESIDDLDFSKINESPRNTDFDARAEF